MDIRKKHAGFTLIELLVVIAIIALLLSILIPGLKRAKDYVKRVVCASRLRQVGVAMISYSQSYEYLPDSLDQNGDPEFGHGYAVYRDGIVKNGKLIPLRWAKLYEAGYMEVPEIFYCPGNRMDLLKYESYTSPGPWGTLPQDYNTKDAQGFSHNQWVRVGYTYFPMKKGSPEWEKSRLVLARKFTELHSALPYATDILHTRSNLSHQRSQGTGDADEDLFKDSNQYVVNAIYHDGHVSGCNDQEVFRHDVWDRFSKDQVGYDEYYLTVFRLIGSR